MHDITLPFPMVSILSALGAIATLLFAQVAVENIGRDDWLNLRRMSIAIGLVLIVFYVPLWYSMYKRFGEFDLIAIISLSTCPIWGLAIGGIRGLRIATYCLLAIFIMYGVVRFIIYKMVGS